MAAHEISEDATMVAIYPPKGWRDLLAAHAHPSQRDKLHTTLVYLGKKSEEDAKKALDIITPIVAKHEPIKMVCNGAGIFDNPDAVVRHLQPNGVGLGKLRADIFMALSKAKLVDEPKFGFMPHMTLEYHEDRKLPKNWERVAKLPFGRWSVNEVKLVRGDKEIGRARLNTKKEAQMNAYETGYYQFMKLAFFRDDEPSNTEKGVSGLLGGALTGGAGLHQAYQLGGMNNPEHVGLNQFIHKPTTELAESGDSVLKRLARGAKSMNTGVLPRAALVGIPVGAAMMASGVGDLMADD